MMETIKVNMTPCEDVQTIHASQNDNEAREWGFELHNNGEKIDSSSISDQLVFKAYEGGTEEILPENGSTPTTSPFNCDIKYPQGLLTDQEFTYRQSPTEEDGLAKITDIKGNTLVWNQILIDGNFISSSGWNSNVSGNTVFASSNELSIVINTLNTNVGVYGTKLSNRVANHKYLFKVDVYTPHATQVRFGNDSDILQRNLSTGWNTVSGIVNNSVTSKVVICYITATSAYGFASGETFKIRNYQCFDLTQMGLDSLTVDEFISLFSKPYYDYCQGAMLSFGGRDVKFNQLMQNGNFNGTTYWVINRALQVTASNNVLSFQLAEQDTYVAHTVSLKKNHKYLWTLDFKTTLPSSYWNDLKLQNYKNVNWAIANRPTTNDWKTYTTVFTFLEESATVQSPYFRCFSYTADAVSVENTCQLRNVMLIDLTEMFGVGNEPSESGFKELFPNDYYEYNVGQYMNLGQPVSLKTVGFNQWDEVWEHGSLGNNGENTGSSASPEIRSTNYIPIVQNASYYLNVPAVAVVHYYGSADLSDYKGNQYIASAQLLNIPNGTRYIRFRTIGSYGDYKNDICLNISDPSRNGQYEPYTESTISLPISTYFPTGMKSAGSVYDELTETKAITRIGSRAYQSGDESDTSVITDGTTTYYVLATPIETSFTTASLVTENGEIPLSNEDGVLIGKCTEELSENPGFFDAKIKLADEDGDVYSNKIQLHVERSPQ